MSSVCRLQSANKVVFHCGRRDFFLSKSMKLLIFLLCLLVGTSFAQDETEEISPYSGERNTIFDWKLVGETIAGEKSNALISPFSVKILLALLYEATGYTANIHTDTELQLRIIFDDPKMPNIAKQREIYKSIIEAAETVHKDYLFKMGSRIFVDEIIKATNKYQVLIKDHYHADVENLTFNNAQESVSKINNWVANITEGRIKSLATEDSVKDAVMLMINAIFFKGHWSKPFDVAATRQDKFLLSTKKSVKVEYMEQSGDFYHEDSKELGAQVLRLPYVGKRFAMFFVLPHEGNTIDQVLSRISTNTSLLNIAMWYMDEVEVNMTIPKFKFDFKTNLNEPLVALGIKDIFSDSASLPLLSRGQGTGNQLKVSNVLQKAGIAVNEKGSEVYAATEIQLVNKFGGDTTKIFYANRPFLFFIEDETNGALLFAGKVENPLDYKN